jgi:D-alanine-D-alanine ligase
MNFIESLNEVNMKQRIAIIAGGDSGEYEISLKSAGVIRQHLDHDLFETYFIHIRSGQWNCQGGDGKNYPVDKNDFTVTLPGGKVDFDGVFIAIHGTPGEDGKIQGYFDMLGIPYNTCDQVTSALTFDKYFCNNVVRNFGIDVSRSLLIKKGQQVNEDEILRQIKLPVFVKPNRGGSSVGTSKVKTRQELAGAIALALHEDQQVMLEEFIPGREFSCGVIWHQGKIRALPVTEIVSKNEFFDYQAKYEEMADEITPAVIPPDITRHISNQSLRLYRLLNCSGIVRFDYILNGDSLYFLEVNTVPGMSERSIVPQQARVAGISLKELFTGAMLHALNNR